MSHNSPVINAPNQTHQNSTSFYDRIRSLQRFAADAVNDYINIFGDILEFLGFVIDRYIGPELFQKILIGSGSRRQHLRTADLCNWNRKNSDSARCSLH